jgi:hypothetical protein
MAASITTDKKGIIYIICTVSQVPNKLLTEVTESYAEKEGNWGSHGKEEESDTLFFLAWTPPYIGRGDIAIVQFVITTVDFFLDPLILQSRQYTLCLL